MPEPTCYCWCYQETERIGNMELADKVSLKDRSDSSIGMRRYEVYDGDTHLGWVVKWDHNREWTGFVAATVSHYTESVASQMAHPTYAVKRLGRTRREAVEEITGWLEIYALYGR